VSDDPTNKFRKVSVFMPESLFQMLDEKRRENKLPMSRLVCYAIDNELDAPSPFSYLCQYPLNEYMQYAYAKEATLIAQWLAKCPSGMPRDQLMLCRRDMGIVDKENFMLAYRELLESKMVGEIDPPKKNKFKKYPDGYKYIMLRKPEDDSKNARMKKKRDTIKRIQKELEDMEES